MQRKTRICFVAEKLAQRSGGAERVMIDTAHALHARGYSVEIVSHEPRGRPPFYKIQKGIVLSNIRPRNELRSRPRRMLDRLRAIFHRNRVFLPGLSWLQWQSQHGGFARRLGKHIDATRPDVVIALMPPAVTALGMAKSDHKPKLLASLHNVPAQDFDNPERWDPNPVDRARRKAVLSRYDRIGILLPEFVDWFPQALRDKLVIMPNAVKAAHSKHTARPDGRHCVVSVGRLADVKQHEILIDAFGRIVSDFPDWTCEIYGVGPIERRLAKQIEDLHLGDSVKLMGDTKTIEAVYNASDILAHPAKFEGFGLVVVEALAHGLPVVGFEDCSGFNHIVRDKVEGLHVSAEGDRVVNFSRALSLLMASGEKRKALGEAGRKRAKDFAPDTVCDLWQATIDSMLDPRNDVSRDLQDR